MPVPDLLDAFVVTMPGLEPLAASELAALRIPGGKTVPGGIVLSLSRRDLVRANLWLRTASRVLVRLGRFRAAHLSELTRRAAALPWTQYLDDHVPVVVRATCHRSRIYHSGAAAERVAQALAEATGRADLPAHGGGGVDEDGAAQAVLVRIDRDACEVSLDASGAHLHRRGYRTETSPAPLRETLAAALLARAGYTGASPLWDPLCGSGTLPIEAALIATRRPPGRHRGFAFTGWRDHDPDLLAAVQAEADAAARPAPAAIRGSDRDAGAVALALRNAGRAGVADLVTFERCAVSAVALPEGPGLVVANPPYGRRLGQAPALRDLYAALGHLVTRARPPWRLALVTPDARLAAATGVSFQPSPMSLSNGGIPVRLFLSVEGQGTGNGNGNGQGKGRDPGAAAPIT
jgi:putative N6-adenine-specific DNA methylase